MKSQALSKKFTSTIFKSTTKGFWKEYKSLILFLVLMSVFRSAVADWNDVPTGSMQPTIVEGDRILVNKMAYDLRIPFTHISLLEIDNPGRGDIVIFDSEVSGMRLVKRVIGVPGDNVSMFNNVLTINNQTLNYKPTSQPTNTIALENLLGKPHHIKVINNGSTLASFPKITVPANHYFVMGDNRNNSADSRVIGFVPREEIIGRTNKVVMSLDYDDYFLPRMDRFLHSFDLTNK